MATIQIIDGLVGIREYGKGGIYLKTRPYTKEDGAFEIEDAAFAQKLIDAGKAIDPTRTLQPTPGSYAYIQLHPEVLEQAEEVKPAVKKTTKKETAEEVPGLES